MSVLKITASNFEEEVMNSKEPVLLDFWADWCGPCRMLSPVIDEVADAVAGKAKVGKVNVDEETDLASKFKIMSIPTLVVIRDGKVVSQTVGGQSKQALIKMLGV